MVNFNHCSRLEFSVPGPVVVQCRLLEARPLFSKLVYVQKYGCNSCVLPLAQSVYKTTASPSCVARRRPFAFQRRSFFQLVPLFFLLFAINQTQVPKTTNGIYFLPSFEPQAKAYYFTGQHFHAFHVKRLLYTVQGVEKTKDREKWQQRCTHSKHIVFRPLEVGAAASLFLDSRMWNMQITV